MGTYNYVIATGLIVPDAGDMRTTVEDEFKAAFGTDLIVTSDTPQGTLINGETTSRMSVVRNNASVANNINPRVAGGIWLDAICAFLGLERRPMTFSIARACILTGVPGTTVPAGSRARSQAGRIFALVRGVVLDGTGSGVGDFQSVDGGPVQCQIGALDSVVDLVLGWETVTNPSQAELGELEQSDSSLRQLRLNTLARQGISTREAQISALYDAPVNALSVAYLENIGSTTAVIEGITMLPHSVWACVDGGLDADIAMALLTNKTDGAAWNGAVTVPVRDDWSGQTYPVSFDRPTKVPFQVVIQVRQGLYVGNAQEAVPPAVVAYAHGAVDSMPGFVVNAPSVSPGEIGAAVAALLPGLFIANVKAGKIADGAPGLTSNETPLLIQEQATIDTGSVLVQVIG